MTIFAWHVHHEILMEPLRPGGIIERLAYIRANKPADEIPIRERLLKELQHPDRIPSEIVEAWRAYDEAGRADLEADRACTEAARAYDEADRAYDEAWRAYDEAWRAYDEAGRAYIEAWRVYQETYQRHLPAIEALHQEECPDCPWNGHTIFPKKAT